MDRPEIVPLVLADSNLPWASVRECSPNSLKVEVPSISRLREAVTIVQG
jgi:hypothetical protein